MLTPGWLLILLVASVAGCAHRNDVVVGPDGQPAILLRCDSHAECLRQAGRKCTTGYEVLDREAGQPGRTTYTVVGSTVVERHRRGAETMMIKCNGGVTPNEGNQQ